MDLSDEALVETFRQTKDSSYFRSLVQRYQNRLYTAAYRILGNKEEAEEVVQETYIKVHQNLHKFRSNSSFAAWVFRIAHNVSLDMFRSKQRRKLIQIFPFDPQSTYGDEDNLDSSSRVVSQVAASGLDPSEQLDLSEASEVIQASLRQLPVTQAMVLVLHDIEGFSYQEVADIVGANLGTVRSRLHYARLKLRQLLEPYFLSRDMSPSHR